MSNLKNLLIATIDAEISARGQSPVVLDTELVSTLNDRQYSIQQIADCVILHHAKFTLGFNQIANSMLEYLSNPNAEVRKALYEYFGAHRLTMKFLSDPETERRVRLLATAHESAESLYGDPEIAWQWLISRVPAIGSTPLNVLKGDRGLELVRRTISVIEDGGFA